MWHIYSETCLFNRSHFLHVILFVICCCCSTTFPLFDVQQFHMRNMRKKKHNAPLDCCEQMRKFNSRKKVKKKESNSLKCIHFVLRKNVWWCCLASNMTNVFSFALSTQRLRANERWFFFHLAMSSCSHRIHLLVTCKFVNSNACEGMEWREHWVWEIKSIGWE